MASSRNSNNPSSLNGCFLTFVPSLVAIGLAIMAIIFFGGISFNIPKITNAALNRPAAVAGSTKLAAFFAPSVLHWSDSVEDWAVEYGVDANLIATVMQIESCGDPQALSVSGAQGLFQVMPFHFEAGEDMRDPETNAFRGISYLKESLNAAQGDVRLALAGYNGGIGVIGQPEMYWPDETRRYSDWGIRIYTEASQKADESSALQEWLNSGGSHLCNQASEKLMLYRP